MDMEDDKDQQTVAGQLQEQQQAWQVCRAEIWIWRP